jgi:hypothetical protein
LLDPVEPRQVPLQEILQPLAATSHRGRTILGIRQQRLSLRVFEHGHPSNSGKMNFR